MARCVATRATKYLKNVANSRDAAPSVTEFSMGNIRMLAVRIAMDPNDRVDVRINLRLDEIDPSNALGTTYATLIEPVVASSSAAVGDAWVSKRKRSEMR